jgi:hypothetical protein
MCNVNNDYTEHKHYNEEEFKNARDKLKAFIIGFSFGLFVMSIVSFILLRLGVLA